MNMDTALILLKQVTVMFLLMGVGFIAYKGKIISDQGSRDLGKLLLYIVMPVEVIHTFCIEPTAERIRDLSYSALLSVIAMGIGLVISRMVYHNSDRIGEFAAAFSNAGFIGIPLVSATFGESAVFYISTMIVLVNALQWTWGAYTITDDRSVINLKAVMKNPIILSVLIGLVLFFLNIRLPAIAETVFSSVIGLNTPVAMILSGIYLAQSNLLGMLRNKDGYILSLWRLILIPAAIMLVFRIIPLGSETMKLAIMLACGCPSGSNVSIFAQQYGKDYRKGIEYVCISTLLCLITLPLLVLLASYIF